ncbi:APC family permease [Vulcanisaeta sp. JCM 14467]
MNVKGQGLFLRESTGLVREIGPWTALLMNTAFIAFQSSFILLVSSMFNFPRGNPLTAIALAALLFLPLTILLNRVGVTYYRTASDYIFITRNLGPSIGFATMFMFVVDQMFFNAVLISLGLITGLAPALLAIGLSNHAQGLISLANSLMSNPLAIFLAGSVIFAVFILINIASSRAGTYLASAISLLGIITFIVTIILLYLYTPQIIKVINTTAPNLLNQASTVTGSLPSNGTVLDTIYLIPYLAYVFPFVNFILSVGGEVRRGSAMPIAIYGTYAISAIFLALGIWVTTSSLGINRLNGLFAIYYGLVSGVTWPSTLPPPYPQALLIMALRNPVLQWLVAIGSFTWYVNVVSVLVIQIARYLLALSFDRVLPSALAYVSSRTHTPIMAHVTDLVITLVIMYLYNFSVVPLLSATMDVSTLVTILMYFMIITITAIALGIRTRSIKTVALGIYTTGLFAWIAYEEVTDPMAYLFVPSINTYIIGFFAALFAVGVAIYYLVRLYRLRRENIDINILFREIPPE